MHFGLSSLRLYIAVFPVCLVLKIDNWKLKSELVSSISSKPSVTLMCDWSRVYMKNLQSSKLPQCVLLCSRTFPFSPPSPVQKTPAIPVSHWFSQQHYLWPSAECLCLSAAPPPAASAGEPQNGSKSLFSAGVSQWQQLIPQSPEQVLSLGGRRCLRHGNIV